MTTRGSLHETTDANVRVIGAFGVGLILVIGAIMATMYAFFIVLSSESPEPDLVPSLQSATRTPYGDLQLPVAPGEELGALRDREDELLHSYGWVDRRAGLVRIPIERAMQLIAQEGLPVRDEQAGTP